MKKTASAAKAAKVKAATTTKAPTARKAAAKKKLQTQEESAHQHENPEETSTGFAQGVVRIGWFGTSRRSSGMALSCDSGRVRTSVVRSSWFLAAALALPGCGATQPAAESSPLSAKIGSQCTVQFRRGDVLGAGGGLPVPPTTGAINGADVAVAGKLLSVGGSWVVVGSDRTEYVIPREAILMIQFQK